MLRGTNISCEISPKKKEDARRLLEIVTDSLIVWGVAVVQAGADILQISDPTSSGDAISASFYREWGFPYTKRMVNALKGTGVKLIMHICGNTSDRLKLLADTGVHGLSLDAKVDFGFARETLGDAYLLMGNVEPTEPLAIGTPQMVYEHSKKVIDKAGRDGHFFLSGGCLIPEFAPVENMQAMFRAALETKY